MSGKYLCIYVHSIYSYLTRLMGSNDNVIVTNFFIFTIDLIIERRSVQKYTPWVNLLFFFLLFMSPRGARVLVYYYYIRFLGISHKSRVDPNTYERWWPSVKNSNVFFFKTFYNEFKSLAVRSVHSKPDVVRHMYT